jgi:hypothetical protein
MTNQEAKLEAIKKAYEKWNPKTFSIIGKVLNTDGFFHDDYINDFVSTSECDQKTIGLGNLLHRPKSLASLESNNGWTRIEPDGSNLPTEEIEYRVLVEGQYLNNCYFNLKYNQFYDFPNRITHYKPIEKELLPIY